VKARSRGAAPAPFRSPIACQCGFASAVCRPFGDDAFSPPGVRARARARAGQVHETPNLERNRRRRAGFLCSRRRSRGSVKRRVSFLGAALIENARTLPTDLPVGGVVLVQAVEPGHTNVHQDAANLSSRTARSAYGKTAPLRPADRVVRGGLGTKRFSSGLDESHTQQAAATSPAAPPPLGVDHLCRWLPSNLRFARLSRPSSRGGAFSESVASRYAIFFCRKPCVLRTVVAVGRSGLRRYKEAMSTAR